MTRIIGIDPGLLHTGWAVIDNVGSKRVYVDSGVILPDPKKNLPERLSFIFNKISEICNLFKPNECSIEITFVNQNPKTTLLLGHARASAIVAVSNLNIPIYEYEPNKIKKALTASGHADKEQVYKMINILMPEAFLGYKKTSDEVDAIAIAITHSNISKLIS